MYLPQEIIATKRDGNRLSKNQIQHFVDGVVQGNFFDYQAKYGGKSEEITPARLDASVIEKVNQIVEKLYIKLGLKGVCRSEFILVDGNPHFLEINTVPGLTPVSLIPLQLEAAGIELSDFFDQLLEQALKKTINFNP